MVDTIVYQIAFSRFPVMLFGRTESSCKGIDFRGLVNIRVGFRYICQKNSSKVHFCIYLFIYVCLFQVLANQGKAQLSSR